jgi:hypothetical protein
MISKRTTGGAGGVEADNVLQLTMIDVKKKQSKTPLISITYIRFGSLALQFH